MAKAQHEIKCNEINDVKELISYYDKWAKDYDKDVTDNRGYIGFEVAARILSQFLYKQNAGTECRILDVGSGTGLAGDVLQSLGYTNIDALDPSEKSHDVARLKGVYKTYLVDVLCPGKKLNIQDNEYDAVMCVGVFTCGHVQAEGAMDEMVRVVKPSGLVCFSIREDVMFDKDYGHEAKMTELCEKEYWKLLSKTYEPYHITGDLMKCYVFVYQVI